MAEILTLTMDCIESQDGVGHTCFLLSDQKDRKVFSFVQKSTFFLDVLGQI